MGVVKIQLKGVGAELALGEYPKTDTKIFEEWTEFFNYNNLVHNSHLLQDHLSEVIITEDEIQVYKGKLTDCTKSVQKSFEPPFEEGHLYLRTECVEQAVYECEFTTDEFDINKLVIETQEYDHLFKTAKAFISNLFYDDELLRLEWLSADSIGNICLLCKYENGYLIPIYDAITKTTSQSLNN
jgi:hypothetical protein